MIRFLLIFCLLSTTLYAQNNLRFTHYTTRDGLSSNSINCVFQDSRGLLWIGTENGLNYFDGVSFQTIYPTDFDAVHLHSDAIAQIAEDAKENILLKTNDGVEEYNWKTKKLKLLFPPSLNEHVYDFITDKQKNFWLLTEKYLQKYNQQFKLLQSIRLDTLKNKNESRVSFYETFYCIDNAINIWFSYHENVYKWNIPKQVLESRFNNIEHKKIFEVKASGITQDKKGHYWFNIHYNNSNDIACYNWNLDSLYIYHSKSNLIPPLVISNSGKIWINSYGDGLAIFNQQNNSFQIIPSNPANANSPANNGFNQIYQDKDENIWLSSNGLDKCTDLSNSFTVTDKFGYEDPQTHVHKASPDIITACNNDLFVCTTAGFFKINIENLKQECFRFNHKKPDDKDYYWINIKLNDKLLLASTLRGLLVYNITSEKLQPLLFSVKHPALLDSVATVSAFKDCNNNIWLGLFGGNGIYCWNTKTNNFIKYDAQQAGKNFFPLRHFSCAAEDDNGNIWMGYDKGGLVIFDNTAQKFIQPSFAAFTVLKSNVIHDIINDHHGNLWISTSSGLFCYNQNTHHYKQYNRTDGLISNILNGMAFDKNGILWIGAYGGLSRFDTSTKQFTNFTLTDGLPAEEIDRVIYDSAINKICCTTPYSVVLFNPYQLKKKHPDLSPVITSVAVMGKQRNPDDAYKIDLSYKEDMISFNYTASELVNPSDVKYEYKLQGLSNNWINAGKHHYATYANLNGGDYAFYVRASTDGMHWYQMTVPVSIHIDTPFFKTAWFYLLICIAVLAIISLFIYAAYRAKLKRVITALKIRNEIASDLHDDIGSSLSSIMLMSEIAKKQQELASDYFDRIKLNAEKIIENMNDIVWAINPNNDSMEQLLARMQSFASSLLEKKNIELDFKTQDSLSSVKLTMEERKNFYLVFKEAIHNAFKYAACNKVTVQINDHAKAIYMIVEDNGKGFDTSVKYTGNGLNNLKKRAVEIKGKLNIISSLNKGTTVTLAFTPTQKGS